MSPCEMQNFFTWKSYMILAKIGQLWKIAGYNVVQKLEFQTISGKGADKSYYRLRWPTLPILFDTMI